MAVQKIEIRPKGTGDYSGVLYPKTSTDMVIDETSGNTVATHMADYVKHPAYATTTGTANTYAVTLTPVPTAYTDGMSVRIKLNVDSTGSSTLNVNALGAIPLKSANGSDASGMKANGIYTFVYNATTGNFMLQGEGVDASPLITANNGILGM